MSPRIMEDGNDVIFAWGPSESVLGFENGFFLKTWSLRTITARGVATPGLCNDKNNMGIFIIKSHLWQKKIVRTAYPVIEFFLIRAIRSIFYDNFECYIIQ